MRMQKAQILMVSVLLSWSWRWFWTFITGAPVICYNWLSWFHATLDSQDAVTPLVAVVTGCINELLQRHVASRSQETEGARVGPGSKPATTGPSLLFLGSRSRFDLLSSFSEGGLTRERERERHPLVWRVSDPKSLTLFGVFPNFQLLYITASFLLKPSKLIINPKVHVDIWNIWCILVSHRRVLWSPTRWESLELVSQRWASINNLSSPLKAIISSHLGPPTLNYSYGGLEKARATPFKRQMSIQRAKMFPVTEISAHHTQERTGPPFLHGQSLLGNLFLNPLSNCLHLALSWCFCTKGSATVKTDMLDYHAWIHVVGPRRRRGGDGFGFTVSQPQGESQTLVFLIRTAVMMRH